MISEALLLGKEWRAAWYIYGTYFIHIIHTNNDLMYLQYGLRVWREYMFDKLASHLTRATLSLLTLIRDNTDSLSSHQIRDVNIQFFPSLIRNQGKFTFSYVPSTDIL